MARVFLSYQRSDRALAQRMVDALSNAGLTVWWDDDVDPREDWDREIEREIEQADFVLALWTRNSVRSKWVRREAMEAQNGAPSKLRQARFDDCKVPLAFNLVPYIDLNPDQPVEDPNWAKLLRWLTITGQPLPRPPRPAPPPAPATLYLQLTIRVSLVLIGKGLMLVAAAVVAYLFLLR